MKHPNSRPAFTPGGRLRAARRLTRWRAAWSSALVALPAGLAGTPALAGVQFTATDLGTLGSGFSNAIGINAAGAVIGNSSLSDGTYSGFIWQSGSIRALGQGLVGASGINDSGAVVGYTASGRAFLIDASGSGHDLGTLGGSYSQANAINNAGLMVGYAYSVGDSSVYPTLWQPLGSSVTSLGALTGTASYNGVANAINAAGAVVGGAPSSSGGVHAFLWQSGIPSDLGVLSGGSASSASGINASGQVVGSSLDNSGYNKAALWQNGSIQNLGTLGGTNSAAEAINDAGVIVGYSQGNISGGSQGFVYTGRAGMMDLNSLLVAGSTATVVDARAINANGQIAATATIAGQSHAVLLTPTGSIAWQATGGGGRFNSGVNWEQGFGPSAFVDATIAPTGTQTVTLDADASVKSLGVGGTAGSSGRPTLALQSGSTLTAAGGVTVQATGTLTGDGTIRGNLANYGTVAAANVSITGSFSNAGLVSGSGVINASLNNTAAGQVRSGAGDDLQVIGSSHTNAGTLDISGGGTQQYTGALGNVAGGRIQLNDAVLRADGGLTNAGQVQISFGGATVHGPVTTVAGGAVILSGNSNSTFYDTVDVNSGGELRVSGGSTGVFFGQVLQRSGSVFSGTGTKFYEGGLSIGNSPALGLDAGSVNFGVANTYLEQIGGIAAGTGFDKYIVAGNLGFGGTLKVVALNGFTFAAGQRYDLFDWGSSEGTFATVDLSAAPLATGLVWDTSALYTTGEIAVTSAVPEPRGGALLLAGLGFVAAIARRRNGR